MLGDIFIKGTWKSEIHILKTKEKHRFSKFIYATFAVQYEAAKKLYQKIKKEKTRKAKFSDYKLKRNDYIFVFISISYIVLVKYFIS
jgi:hypothetical protein